jgi:hypothetical protein
VKQYQNSMQTVVAFSFPVWNGPAMPRRKVALSGLLAFGAGVAVGANFPRAGNIVGYILQRLGFELTNLTLWMWDPEKSVVQEAKPRRVAVRKRAQRPQLRETDPLQTQRRASAKTRTRSRRIHSETETLNATGETRADPLEPWIFNSRLDRSPKNAKRVSRVKSSDKSNLSIKTAHRGARSGRKKTNGATVKAGQGRKTRTTGNARKAKVFAGSVSPASAALN